MGASGTRITDQVLVNPFYFPSASRRAWKIMGSENMVVFDGDKTGNEKQEEELAG